MRLSSSFAAIHTWPALLVLAVGLALILTLRLPLLLGDAAYLDGDEALVGLMAIDLLQEGRWPWYFWGQAYGLCSVEAGMGALAFFCFGISDVVLRLSTLLIFALGFAAFVWTLAGMGGKPGLALLLACCPAWACWAMAPRGGYVSAFALTWLAMGLMLRAADRPAAWPRMLALGGCVAGIWAAQGLWLFVLAPFGLQFLRQREFGKRLGMGLVGVLALGLPLQLLKPQTVFWDPEVFQDLAAWPGWGDPLLRLQRMFAGSYYLEFPPQQGWMMSLAGWLWMLTIPTCLARAGWSLITRRPDPLAMHCAAGMLGLLAINVPTGDSPRYLLPLACLACFYLAAGLSRLMHRHPEWIRPRLLSLLLAAVGAGAILQAAAFPRLRSPGAERHSSRLTTNRAITHLDAKGIRHVFATMGLSKWSLMFYSQGSIKARSPEANDRRTDWLRAVDSAWIQGKPTALVVWLSDNQRHMRWAIAESGKLRDRLQLIDDQIAIYTDPDQQLLKTFGFQVPEREDPK